MHLSGKKILLTGASSGNDSALFAYLIANLIKVVHFGSDVAKVNYLINNNHCEFIKLDLNEFSNYNLLIEERVNEEKYDGVILCAGMKERLPLTLNTPEKIQKVYQINVFSGIELLRSFSKRYFVMIIKV
jgi:short-subunit dehydrogenase